MKTYDLPPKEDYINSEQEDLREKVIKSVQSEINYLRELHHCDNVITLKSVYKSLDQY